MGSSPPWRTFSMYNNKFVTMSRYPPEEELNQEELFETRKAKFSNFLKSISRYLCSEEQQNHKLKHAINQGYIPDYFPWHKYDDYKEYEEETGKLTYNQYFYTCLIPEGIDILSMSIEDVEDRLEELQEAKPSSTLPSDGSKGQWRASNKARITACKWFLGQDKQ